MKSVLCAGVTGKKAPCKQRCTVGFYCRFHKKQIKGVVGHEPKILEMSSDDEENATSSDEESVEYVKSTLPEYTDCAICLCDIKLGDCKLKCGHTYHAECIGKWIETGSHNSDECPMCRKSIEFMKTPLKVNTVLKTQNTTLRQTDMINEDVAFARNLDAQENRVTHIHTNEYNEDEVTRRVLEESMMSFENDDYNTLADALEQSYRYAELEEEKLIEDAIQANTRLQAEEEQEMKERINRESIHDTISRLMQGKNFVTIKLK